MQLRRSDRHGRVGYLGLIALAALIGWFGGPAFGGPVLTEPVTLAQPDGMTFVARPGGDEWFNWFSYEGTLIVQDEAGWWRYAQEVNGAMEPGAARAAVDAVPGGAATVDDVPRLAAKVERPQAIYASPGAPTTRTVYHRGLVILVEFQDVSLSTSDAYWSNLFFGTSGKTVRNYLDEVSGGTVVFTAVGDACCPPDYVSDGVIRVRLQPSDHNGGNHPNPGGTIDDRNRWIVYDALYRADQYEAFNAFDNSLDGVITPNELHIIFVIAGYDRGYGDASTPAVIGHRWALGFTYGENVPAVQLDGVTLCAWNSNPALDSGYMQIGELHGDHAATMGEPCHEMGHDLGLPDLYDTTGASSGIGGHGLMGYGGWGTASGDAEWGETPTHLCPWSKQKLGFVTPQVVSANADFTLVGTGSDSYNALRINTADANQYFLVENRQLQGFDAGLYRWFSTSSGGTGGGGLAIWHIDESMANNNTAAHKKVDLEEANQGSLGYSELDTLVNQGNRHHYFYSGHVGDFGDATTPGSRLYNGNSTDLNVSSISVSGNAMKCYVAVAKQTQLAWATYLGGGDADYAYDLAVDGSENVYVAGNMNLGGQNRNVVKLTSAGAYVNAIGIDLPAEGIDVDGSGNTYLTGCGQSWFMARPSPTYGDSPPYVYDYTYNGGNGCGDVVVAKIDSTFHYPGFGQSWATFLGGGPSTDGGLGWSGVDVGYGIAVNSSGEPVVAGRVDSRNFPVVPSGSSTYGHYGDGFVAKLNSTGTGLLYSRYLAEQAYSYSGGTRDEGHDVAYDPSGNAWVVGLTQSDDFDPCKDWTFGFQSTFRGGLQDAFLVKVGTTGSLLAASYLGGNDVDAGYSIAVDSSGYPYATGLVHSLAATFPLVGAFDSYNYYGPNGDTYITKPNTDGRTLVYSTFYGGFYREEGHAIDVDAQSNMYLAGFTESDDLQISASAPFPTRAGGRDAFVAKLLANGTTLAIGTYLGGSSDDEAHGVAVGGSGAIYVAGFTLSTDFPTTPGAYDESHNGSYDAFVAKLAIVQVADSLVVGVPDGGETWCVDQSVTIQWSSSGAGSYVKIELSRDGNDGPWETLYACTNNDGTENWTVTGADSSNCYVRITDTADGTLTDIGNAAFTIMTCAPPPDPPTPPTGQPGYRKIRYISLAPANAGIQTALRVTLTDPPAPFDAFDGQQMWVGEAVTKCENAGQATPPAGGCGAAPGLPLNFRTASMQCTPYCMDYGAVGALHVTDDEIVPNAIYDVQAIDCNADFEVEANYSDPLTIRTSKWGDLVGNCGTIPCTAPDGIVNITTDVTSVLDKFKNLPGAVMKSRADLEPNKAEWLVNITDVTKCLDAFLGQTYPPTGWAGPGGCPPTGPRVEAYGDSGCLGGRLLDRRTTAEPCSDDDSIELISGPGTLDVIHGNATYNCCQDDIRVSSSVQGSLLRLIEDEVPLGGYCDCICCFNVEAAVVDIAPGEYTVEYCWLDDEQGLRCHTDDIVIP